MKLLLAFATVLVANLAATPCLAAGDSGFGFSHHIPGDAEANFLINLFRYVAWPHSPPGTATICFLRPSDVQSRLQSGVSLNEKWAQLPDHKVVVKVLSDTEAAALTGPEDTLGCQILFLDARTADKVWPTLSASHMPAGLLTVSTQKDFATRGGMIQFIWDDPGTYRIGINQANVARADVVISVALGTLADRVDDERYRSH
jgi:hypothetical protein